VVSQRTTNQILSRPHGLIFCRVTFLKSISALVSSIQLVSAAMAVFGPIFGSDGTREISVIYTLALLSIVYIFSLCFYRIYLTPAAQVPGPLLAKLTYW